MILGFLLGQDTAMNVNHFEQTVSELQILVFRTNSKAADNKRKEIACQNVAETIS